MVLYVSGTPLSEAPPCPSALYQQFPGLREGASRLVRQMAGAARGADYNRVSLYVTTREFATARSSDSRLEMLATDSLANNLAIVLRNNSTGHTLLAQVDRLTSSDVDAMTSSLSPQHGFSSPLSLSLVGSYQDRAGVSLSLLAPILSTLHHHPHHLDLEVVCIGDMATSPQASSTPLPALPGLAVSLRTGELFPLADCSMEHGPDMDLRTARTLAASGDKVPGMLAVYDCQREQLSVGPFTWEPMRAVDIWLGQGDDFLVQSLCPCPESLGQGYPQQLRAALSLVKSHPYPSVTLFPSDSPRLYAKAQGGQWVALQQVNTATVGLVPIILTLSSLQAPSKLSWYPGPPVKSESFPCLPTSSLASCHFKTEPLPWQATTAPWTSQAFF